MEFFFNTKSFLSTVLYEGSDDSRPYKGSALIGILLSLEWQFRTNVSGQPTGPIFKGQTDCPFHCRLTAARPLKMGPIGCLETSLRNYHSTVRTVQNKELRYLFYALLTVHLGIIFVNNQLDAQFFFSCMFISILYMFRAAMCPSSGELIVPIRHLVYVTLYR